MSIEQKKGSLDRSSHFSYYLSGKYKLNKHFMDDVEKNDEQLVPGRIPLSEVKKQVSELKMAKQAFDQANPKSKRIFDAVSMYSVAIDFAFMIAIPLIAFVYLGKWADTRFGTKYLVVIGIFLGIATSVIAIAKQINKLSKQLKNKK